MNLINGVSITESIINQSTISSSTKPARRMAFTRSKSSFCAYTYPGSKQERQVFAQFSVIHSGLKRQSPLSANSSHAGSTSLQLSCSRWVELAPKYPIEPRGLGLGYKHSVAQCWSMKDWLELHSPWVTFDRHSFWSPAEGEAELLSLLMHS